MYSTIILDSHVLFREGLNKLLESNNEINVIGNFDLGRDCLKLIQNTSVDLVITDVQLLDISYYELIDQIRSLNSNCKIVILSETNNPYDLCDIYELNIDAFIFKKVTFDIFLKIIKDVLNDKKYFEPDALPIVNSQLMKKSIQTNLINKLTRREIQMLVRIAEGMSNKEIAVDCNISERTVKNHLSSIFQKIEVSDRTQAAVFAIKTNLVQI